TTIGSELQLLQGEIQNVTRHRNGPWYITLRPLETKASSTIELCINTNNRKNIQRYIKYSTGEQLSSFIRKGYCITVAGCYKLSGSQSLQFDVNTIAPHWSSPGPHLRRSTQICGHLRSLGVEEYKLSPKYHHHISRKPVRGISSVKNTAVITSP